MLVRVNVIVHLCSRQGPASVVSFNLKLTHHNTWPHTVPHWVSTKECNAFNKDLFGMWRMVVKDDEHRWNLYGDEVVIR